MKWTAFLWIILVPLLKAVPVFAQGKSVALADYAKWSTLYDEKISEDGTWVSYKLDYEYGEDTLFVQHIKSGKKMAFAASGNYSFSKNGKLFAVVDKEATLTLLDLASGKSKSYLYVNDFKFCDNALAVLIKTEKSQRLTIVEQSTGKETSVEDCVEFSISTTSKIAAATKLKLLLIDSGVITEVSNATSTPGIGFKKIAWSGDSKAFAFLEEIRDSATIRNYKIYHYNLPDGRLSCLNPVEIKQFEGLVISGDGNTPLKFSSDGSQVYFSYSAPQIQSAKEPYEIWDSDTPYEYGWNKLYGDAKKLPKAAQWTVSLNKVVLVGTETHPNAMLTIDSRYALCYDISQYEPQYEQDAPVDLYLKNNITQTETLFLIKQSTAVGINGVSPKGNFIHYFRYGNWWIYDIRSSLHINLTAQLPVQVVKNDEDNAGQPYPYKSPSWSSDEKYFFVYDKYDIWLINVYDQKARKITDGRSTKVRFRICEKLYPTIRKPAADEYLVRNIDISTGLILTANSDSGESGYYRWTLDGSLAKILFGNSGKSRLQKAENTSDYIYIEQTAENPPRLMHLKNVISKIVFQSNKFAKKFEWGKAALIEYKSGRGNALKGILYRPANYTAGKKYPMIVYIYEKLSAGYHDYIVPSEYSPIGFNPSTYFLDGYLVLFPDIEYTFGNPGVSALQCVLSAVNKVKSMGIVDENRIGLIGHSFGGYETSFMITKTNVFSAAVCGAAVMNTVSGYFSNLTPARRSDAWRYESQQFRMGYSPFENWDAYMNNSALPNAMDCSTPLLSWAGKKDTSVAWTQSAEFHMALRRLGKKNLFLLYENEGHRIKTPELQKDLSLRTKHWFDLYLKR